MLWAIGLIGAFYLMTLVLGFGAAALLDTGPDSAGRRRPSGNLASPLLAEAVGGGAGSTGGAILLALISAVAFATILAVVAGLTLTSASSFAHDLYANVFKKGKARRRRRSGSPGSPRSCIGGDRDRAGHPGAEAEHRVPGRAGLRGRRVGEPAVAALQPVLARFNTRGAIWSIYGGLISASCWCSSRRSCPARATRPASLSLFPATSTSPGSRWRTRASSRSRSASCSAGSARSPRRDPRAEERLRRARGALPDRRRRRKAP